MGVVHLRHEPRRFAAAAAFAFVVGLEATLFGAYVTAGSGHDHGPSADTSAAAAVAAVLLAVAGAAFPLFLQTLDPDQPTRRRLRRSGGVLLALALLSTAAALVHFAVLWEHVREYWLFGVFFGLLGAFQLAWSALVVLWPTRRLLSAGVLVNLSVIAVWLLSRAAGLPVGPERWGPEPVGVADALATAFELAIAIVGVACLSRTRRQRRSLVGTPVVSWSLPLVLVVLVTVALLSAAGAIS